MAQYIVRIAGQGFVHYWRTGLPVGGAATAQRDEATRYDHRTAHRIAADLIGLTGDRVTVVRANDTREE